MEAAVVVVRGACVVAEVTVVVFACPGVVAEVTVVAFACPVVAFVCPVVVCEGAVVLFVCPGVVSEEAVELGSNCSAGTRGAGVFLFLALTESTLVKQRQSKRNDFQSPHRRSRGPGRFV